MLLIVSPRVIVGMCVFVCPCLFVSKSTYVVCLCMCRRVCIHALCMCACACECSNVDCGTMCKLMTPALHIAVYVVTHVQVCHTVEETSEVAMDERYV